jgi:chromosome segregation ATPase
MEAVTDNGTDILRSKLEDKFDECDELREDLKDLQKSKELVEYQLEQANDEIAKLEKEIKNLSRM